MADVVWNETEGQVQDRLRAQVARLEAERDAAIGRAERAEALAEEWGKKLDKHHYPLKRDDDKCWLCYHFAPAEAQARQKEGSDA